MKELYFQFYKDAGCRQMCVCIYIYIYIYIHELNVLHVLYELYITNVVISHISYKQVFYTFFDMLHNFLDIFKLIK